MAIAIGEPIKIDLEPIKRLKADLRVAAATLTTEEVRYMVDCFYSIQDYRKASGNQQRALGDAEPHTLLDWYFSQMDTVEAEIKKALDLWTDGQVVGRWAKSIVGIGPVLSAGLLAHIDITKAPTCGHIWRYAGLDPTSKWGKGQKRPWNASLRVVTWKLGQSFMKFQNHKDDFYGKLYVQRKAYEIGRNNAGELADQAAAALTAKKIGKDTVAYKAYIVGRLPDAHIDARARRWTVKLFLSGYHAVAFYDRYGMMPPKPYVLSILGHADEIQVPNWPF